jgi:hypothetical protein
MQHLSRHAAAFGRAAFALLAGIALSRAAAAQNPAAPVMPPMQHGHMADHGAMSVADARQAVQFPAMMRTQFLGNMRDHVETLNAILGAMAASDYAAAGQIAATRLGLDSPSAEGCRPGAATSAAAPDSMGAMMQLFMPEPMRALGLSMHTAASAFAVAAEHAAVTHDGKPVAEALAQITPNCVACHAAFRLQ